MFVEILRCIAAGIQTVGVWLALPRPKPQQQRPANLHSAREVALVYRLKTDTIVDLTQRGFLRCYQVGPSQAARYDLAEVEAFLKRRD